jgi:hypothetical protein
MSLSASVRVAHDSPEMPRPTRGHRRSGRAEFSSEKPHLGTDSG